jgi:hypothetical protein
MGGSRASHGGAQDTPLDNFSLQNTTSSPPTHPLKMFIRCCSTPVHSGSKCSRIVWNYLHTLFEYFVICINFLFRTRVIGKRSCAYFRKRCLIISFRVRYFILSETVYLDKGYSLIFVVSKCLLQFRHIHFTPSSMCRRQQRQYWGAVMQRG